jgi:hypothetical protein
VPSAGIQQRCGFCGQMAGEGSEVRGPAHSSETPQIRWKGRCCGG